MITAIYGLNRLRLLRLIGVCCGCLLGLMGCHHSSYLAERTGSRSCGSWRVTSGVLGGVAVVRQAREGCHRLRWRLIHAHNQWRLELYSLVGTRILTLSRLSSGRYQLVEGKEKLEVDNFQELQRRISGTFMFMDGQELVNWLWWNSVNSYPKVIDNQVENQVTWSINGWQLAVTEWSWQPKLQRRCPSGLYLRRSDVMLQLKVDRADLLEFNKDD